MLNQFIREPSYYIVGFVWKLRGCCRSKKSKPPVLTNEPKQISSSSKTVLFSRHGQGDHNASLPGWNLVDPPLNATGLGQARDLHERLGGTSGPLGATDFHGNMTASDGFYMSGYASPSETAGLQSTIIDSLVQASEISSICLDTCQLWSASGGACFASTCTGGLISGVGDGTCSQGDPAPNICALGTDCTDCGAYNAAALAITSTTFQLNSLEVIFSGDLASGGTGAVRINYTFNGNAASLEFPLCSDFIDAAAMSTCLVAGIESSAVLSAFGLSGR